MIFCPHQTVAAFLGRAWCQWTRLLSTKVAKRKLVVAILWPIPGLCYANFSFSQYGYSVFLAERPREKSRYLSASFILLNFPLCHAYNDFSGSKLEKNR